MATLNSTLPTPAHANTNSVSGDLTLTLDQQIEIIHHLLDVQAHLRQRNWGLARHHVGMVLTLLPEESRTAARQTYEPPLDPPDAATFWQQRNQRIDYVLSLLHNQPDALLNVPQ